MGRYKLPKALKPSRHYKKFPASKYNARLKRKGPDFKETESWRF